MASKKKPEDSPVPVGHTASLGAIQNIELEDAPKTPNITKYHRVDINWDKVETAMAMGGDLKMCAMFGGCHWNTLERRIIERYGEGFKEVRQALLTDRKAMALKAMWNQVAKGNWRAIRFANVVFNGLNDRPREAMEDDENDEGSTFKIAYDPHEPPPPIDAEYTPMESE